LAEKDAELAANLADVEDLRSNLSEVHAQNAVLDSKLAEKDAELAANLADVEDLRSNLSGVHAQNAMLDSKLAEKETDLASNATDIQHLRSSLGAAQARCDEKDAELARNSSEAVELRSKLGAMQEQSAKQDYKLADMHTALAEKNKHIADLQVDQKDAAMHAMSDEVSDLQLLVQRLKGELATHAGAAETLQDEIKMLKANVLGKEARIAEKDAEIACCAVACCALQKDVVIAKTTTRMPSIFKAMFGN